MITNPSGREMADIAIENGAIDMAQGVVHTPPPPEFLEELNKIYPNRHPHIYASPAGYKPYREALLKMARLERASLELENIMATNGVTGGLVSALRSHLKPLDKVVLLEPFYPAHDWAIQALHAVTEYVRYTPEFTLDWDAIEASLVDASAFLLGNPANPTGLLTSHEDLVKLHNLCKKHDVLLIVDEVYKDFVWEGSFTSLLSTVEDLNHLVILRSFSKNLALAGWRTGYAITSPERRANMTHIHDALYVGAPAMPQFVMAELLTNHTKSLDTFVQNVLQIYKQNREAVITAFTAYGMNPLPKQGAYYMLVRHNQQSDIGAMKSLLEKGIAAAPGVPFHRPGTQDTGYLRIHFAQSPEDREKIVSILKG